MVCAGKIEKLSKGKALRTAPYHAFNMPDVPASASTPLRGCDTAGKSVTFTRDKGAAPKANLR